MTTDPTGLANSDATFWWISVQVCFSSTQRDWPQVAALHWVQEHQSRKLCHFLRLIRSGIPPGTLPVASNPIATKFCARIFIGGYHIPQY